MVIIVFGLPGSGKSYFAKKLAGQLNAKYVNSDQLRKQLFSARTYSEDEKKMVYDAMLMNVQTAIAQKKNLVLDATFHSRAMREPFMEEAKKDIFFIEVQADESTIKERLKRPRPFSEADFGVYQLISDVWEPLEIPHLVLKSTNNNIDTMLLQAVAHL